MKKILLFIFLCVGFQATNLSAQTATKDSTAVNLNDYVGKYKFTEGFAEASVEVKDGSLYAEIDSYGQNKINKQDAVDTFKSTSSYGTVFIFKRNAEGKVTGVTLQLMGQEVSGEKTN